MLHTLIMAGGGGTRFWPRSRRDKPKQFLCLTGERTLLQQTLDRVEVLAPPARSWIITGSRYVAETARQLPDLPGERIIGEPAGRDTAACIGLGAALMLRADADATMLVMPADHVIEPVQEFRRAIHVAQQLVEENPGALVTLGIRPTFASTGYGYIERAASLPPRQSLPIHRVNRFYEKPRIEVAEQYVASGRFFWNSGIFLWKASTIMASLRVNQPALAVGVERIAAAWDTPEQDETLSREFSALPKISIDYAVMEKAKEVLVIEAPFVWDDVGSWLALERMQPQDANENTVQANHLGWQTKRCVIVGDADKLIATVGVEDLVIIQDGDAILVAHRRDEGNIKQIVEQLGARGLEKHQ